MKKKILVCVYSCVSESGVKHVGGEAGLGWNLVKQLSRFFDVYAITHYQNRESIEKLLEKESVNNIKFFYIKLPRFFNFLEQFHKGGIQVYSYIWQIKAYFVAKKLHKKINFDAFHHITYANDWMASFIGALLPIPYIRGPGGGAQRIPKNFLKEYSFKKHLDEWIRGVSQWVFKHDPFFIMGQKKAKAILVCNRESFEALPKGWREKAFFFPVNGVSTKELLLEDAKLGYKNNDFLILSAGKLIKIKGFDLAIKSFKIFSDKMPNVKFIIVGDGPEFKNLKRLSQKLDIEYKVIFEEWLSREKLLEKMISCDVFLFASLRDGGGAVIVEAMSLGKPVVCFDLAGPGFHIDEKCGIKIKPENPEQAMREMADAIEKLYFDKNLRAQLGRGAKIKAEQEYNWDKLGERLLKIYNEALKINSNNLKI